MLVLWFKNKRVNKSNPLQTNIMKYLFHFYAFFHLFLHFPKLIGKVTFNLIDFSQLEFENFESEQKITTTLQLIPWRL